MNEGEGTVVVESSPSKDVYDDSRWPPRFLYVNTHAWCSSSWIRATICIARVYGSGCKLNREGSGGGGGKERKIRGTWVDSTPPIRDHT